MLAEASSVLDRSLHAAHVVAVDHAARRARARGPVLGRDRRRGGGQHRARRRRLGRPGRRRSRAACSRAARADGPRARDEPAGAASGGDGRPARSGAAGAARRLGRRRIPSSRDELAALDAHVGDGRAAARLARGRSAACCFASLGPQRRFDRDDLALARELADRVGAGARERAAARHGAARAGAAEVAAHELRAAQRRFSSAFANAPIGMALVSARDGLVEPHRRREPGVLRADRLRARTSCCGRDLIETLVHPSSRRIARERARAARRRGEST